MCKLYMNKVINCIIYCSIRSDQLITVNFSLLQFAVHVVLVIFVYLVYTGSKELGSPGVIYERLKEVSSRSRVCMEPISHGGQSCGPVDGNYKGSYLTMLSSSGLVFGIINIVGNFGTVFVDNVGFSNPLYLLIYSKNLHIHYIIVLSIYILFFSLEKKKKTLIHI